MLPEIRRHFIPEPVISGHCPDLCPVQNILNRSMGWSGDTAYMNVLSREIPLFLQDYVIFSLPRPVRDR